LGAQNEMQENKKGEEVFPLAFKENAIEKIEFN